jgi:hypothetical protein
MKRVTILLAAGLVLLAAASLPIIKAAAQQAAVTDDNLNQMITSAKTPEITRRSPSITIGKRPRTKKRRLFTAVIRTCTANLTFQLTATHS